MAYGYARRFKVRRPMRKQWRRRSAYGKRWSGVGSMRVRDLASAAYSGVKYLRGLVNSELYSLDNQSTASNLLTTGAVVHLTAVAQGDGDGARTGNSIYVRSVNMRLACAWASAGNAGQIVKWALVEDTQQIGDTTPGFTDIYDNNNVVAHLSETTKGRFTIHKTGNLVLSVNNPRELVQCQLTLRHHVRYNGTVGSDVQKGGLYLVLVSDQSSSNGPSIVYDVRVSYHDN